MGIRSRELASGEGWRVHDVTCDSGPRDRPFDEQHSAVCIALVTEGSFQYRSPQGAAMMAPGSLMLGNVGGCFTCGHEHRAGDHCLSFRYSPEYFERIVASVPRARLEFRVPRLPPGHRLLPVLSHAHSFIAASKSLQTPDFALLEEVALRLAGVVCSALAESSAACP